MSKYIQFKLNKVFEKDINLVCLDDGSIQRPFGGSHRMIFPDGKKITFIHQPKTGGMSMHYWFFKNFPQCEHYLTEGHEHSKRTKEVFKNETGFTFSIVRNPWDWYVSRYTHYMSGRPRSKYHFVDFLMMLNYGINGKILISKSPLEFEKFHEDVDIVFRLEEIGEKFKVIHNITNCYEPLDFVNITRRKWEHYSFYYDEEMRQIVHTRHRDFIEKWGYKFEDLRGDAPRMTQKIFERK